MLVMHCLLLSKAAETDTCALIDAEPIHAAKKATTSENGSIQDGLLLAQKVLSAEK